MLSDHKSCLFFFFVFFCVFFLWVFFSIKWNHILSTVENHNLVENDSHKKSFRTLVISKVGTKRPNWVLNDQTGYEITKSKIKVGTN